MLIVIGTCDLNFFLGGLLHFCSTWIFIKGMAEGLPILKSHKKCSLLPESWAAVALRQQTQFCFPTHLGTSCFWQQKWMFLSLSLNFKGVHLIKRVIPYTMQIIWIITSRETSTCAFSNMDDLKRCTYAGQQ